jgi:ribosomal protein S18 acetylase RimI-like enzyme
MIQLRRATLDDEAAILKLAPRLVAFGPPPWRDVEGMRATDRAVLSAALRSASEEALVLVAATSDNEVAGFIHLTTTLDYYLQRKNAHVADIVVSENFEGQGIARQLLAEAEKWARSIGSPWLTIAVFEQNVRAAELYERVGFKREVLRMLMPLDNNSLGRRP